MQIYWQWSAHFQAIIEPEIGQLRYIKLKEYRPFSDGSAYYVSYRRYHV